MNAIAPDLHTANTSPVVLALETALRETFAVYLAAHLHHWNVEGERFTSLHDFFETQYRDTFEALDLLAERIRALGVPVTAGFAAGAPVPAVAGDGAQECADAMLRDLQVRNETVAAALRAGLDVVAKAGDPVTEDLLTGRLAVHEKSIWMLKAMQS